MMYFAEVEQVTQNGTNIKQHCKLYFAKAVNIEDYIENEGILL